MSKIVITNLSQKKNKKYIVKTNLEEEYVVSEDTIIKFHLFKDSSYTKDEFKKIIYDIKINEYFNKVLKYLSYGPRSEYEIRLYIQKIDNEKILHRNDYDEIIERLKSLNYINDELYAKQIIEYYKETKGRNYILNFLREKKVDNEFIEKLLEEYSIEEEIEIGLKISNKYLLTIRKFPFKKQRNLILSKLQRSGFSSTSISKIMNSIKYIDESDETLERDILKLKKKLEKKNLSPYEEKQYIINSLMIKGYEYRNIIDALK